MSVDERFKDESVQYDSQNQQLYHMFILINIDNYVTSMELLLLEQNSKILS